MEAQPEFRAGDAIAFPGMGPSPFSESAKFMLINPIARKMAAAADEVLGYSLVDRYRESEGDYSEAAQVAFLVNCLALAAWAQETLGARPSVCAGASFGGKAAAVHTGSLDFADAVWMTAEMARREDEYFAREYRDAVTHSFARTPGDRLDEILAELAERGAWHEISCHIDEDFFMLSLDGAEVEGLDARLRAVGGLPLYSMKPPMHCAAFGELRERIEREVVAELTFRTPEMPLIADQDGRVVDSGEGVRRMILDGYTLPVRWPEVVSGLRGQGVSRLFMCGPDRLFGRVAVTTRNFEVVQVDPRTAMAPRRGEPGPRRAPALPARSPA
ncbi:ACP S-malonyltransferase [Streptomyces sp. NPDC006450]|uniref:ACP S-malonyltransferase n=1 Tax=Streptomyces sp. NPDC006450 TaxID=3155458 RepID=UPI0033ABEA3F